MTGSLWDQKGAACHCAMASGKHTLHLLSCCMEIVLVLHRETWHLAVTDKQMGTSLHTYSPVGCLFLRWSQFPQPWLNDSQWTVVTAERIDGSWWFLFRKIQNAPHFTKICLPLHTTCLRLLVGIESGPSLLMAPLFLTSVCTASQDSAFSSFLLVITLKFQILGWPKSSFRFSHKNLWKTQTNILANPVLWNLAIQRATMICFSGWFQRHWYCCLILKTRCPSAVGSLFIWKISLDSVSLYRLLLGFRMRTGPRG